MFSFLHKKRRRRHSLRLRWRVKHNYEYDYWKSTQVFFDGKQILYYSSSSYHRTPNYSGTPNYSDSSGRRIFEWIEAQEAVRVYIESQDFQPIYWERYQQLSLESNREWMLVKQLSSFESKDRRKAAGALNLTESTLRWRQLEKTLREVAATDASTSPLARFMLEAEEIRSPENQALQRELDEAYEAYHRLNIRYLEPRESML